MTDVKSKNLYELLGNTSDQDSDREPEPPTKTVDKPAARHGKRDAPKAAPAPAPAGDAPAAAKPVAARGRGGNRSGGFSGNEAAFRERATGRTFNRDQPTAEGEDIGKPGRDRGPGAARPRRGGGGPRRGGDRHSRTGIAEHPKQEGHGWGEATGEGEWADERAGEAIATQEVKEGGFDAAADPTPVGQDGQAAAPEAEAEPEDTSKSYADYLAEQAAKKLSDLGLKEARAPNEGVKDNKKWKAAKEFVRDENDTYFEGKEKAQRERDRNRNAKQVLDIDYSFKEPPREARGRGGGRGRGRGGGERGDRGGDRPDRPERTERPDRGDRGDFRGGRGRGDFGGRGRGDRGEFRGGRGRGRGGDSTAVAVNDESAFPSLGTK